MRRTPLFLAGALVLAGGCAGLPYVLGGADAGAGSASAPGEMSATLRLADGTDVGTVDVVPHADGLAAVEVALAVPVDRTTVRAFHGLHVHANDDPANGEGCTADPAQPSASWFTSADGHLKDGAEVHGGHQGDMPPLLVDGQGRASATFTTDRLPLDRLAGRAVVVHAGPDNLGNIPTGTAEDQYTPNSPAALEKTRNTGNAGDRLACGVLQTP